MTSYFEYLNVSICMLQYAIIPFLSSYLCAKQNCSCLRVSFFSQTSVCLQCMCVEKSGHFEEVAVCGLFGSCSCCQAATTTAATQQLCCFSFSLQYCVLTKAQGNSQRAIELLQGLTKIKQKCWELICQLASSCHVNTHRPTDDSK